MWYEITSVLVHHVLRGSKSTKGKLGPKHYAHNGSWALRPSYLGAWTVWVVVGTSWIHLNPFKRPFIASPNNEHPPAPDKKYPMYQRAHILDIGGLGVLLRKWKSFLFAEVTSPLVTVATSRRFALTSSIATPPLTGPVAPLELWCSV